MKMPVMGVIMPSNNFEKLDETLLLLRKVSLSLVNTAESVATYQLSQNENQNNGTQSPVVAGLDVSNDSAFDPDVLYSRVFKLHRSGRVSKKLVNKYFSRKNCLQPTCESTYQIISSKN